MAKWTSHAFWKIFRFFFVLILHFTIRDQYTRIGWRLARIRCIIDLYRALKTFIHHNSPLSVYLVWFVVHWIKWLLFKVCMQCSRWVWEIFYNQIENMYYVLKVRNAMKRNKTKNSTNNKKTDRQTHTHTHTSRHLS